MHVLCPDCFTNAIEQDAVLLICKLMSHLQSSTVSTHSYKHGGFYSNPAGGQTLSHRVFIPCSITAICK